MRIGALVLRDGRVLDVGTGETPQPDVAVANGLAVPADDASGAEV